VAIVHPLKRRMSKKRAVTIIILIWFCGTILSFPTLLFSKTFSYRYANEDIRILCIMIWPDGMAGFSLSDNMSVLIPIKYLLNLILFRYNVVFLLSTYIIPIISMVFTYSVMGRVLWGHKAIGESTESQRQSIKNKRKIVRMFMVMITIFAICWSIKYHVDK
jgi:tachykinin receptor 3